MQISISTTAINVINHYGYGDYEDINIWPHTFTYQHINIRSFLACADKVRASQFAQSHLYKNIRSLKGTVAIYKV